MAEMLVSSVVTNIVRLMISEAELLKDVYEDLQDIKEDLETIHPFLKDADSKANDNNRVMAWVLDVKFTANSIEDFIDAYLLTMGKPRKRHVPQNLYPMIRKIKYGHELTKKMEKIKELVHNIIETCFSNDLQISDQESDDHVNLYHTAHSYFIKKRQPMPYVARTTKDELITRLQKKACLKRALIAVVGEEGMGKTTLVNNVYTSQIRSGYFDRNAWITLSPSYKLDEVLKSIINQFNKGGDEAVLAKGIESMDEKVLMETICVYLSKKRYLVVFEDVWNIDFWTSARKAFPDNNNGSRVIITTHNPDVASSCLEYSQDYVLSLSGLPANKAWELFCKKAFQFDFGGICPRELYALSKKIVKRCQGLPLAIAVIGGLLSTKEKNEFQWNKMNQMLKSNPKSDGRHKVISQILQLCYQDLPPNLKPCFLYFAIFPEGYYVSCNRLVKLWIAEGFVEPRRGRTLEEVADEYLAELGQRNLVHVPKISFDGKFRKCQVHGLLRDLIMSIISQELSFCQILSEQKSDVIGRARRISIHGNISTPLKSSVTRSIFLFKVQKLPPFFMHTLCKDFKLLKVMDFEGAPLESLPKEVGDLLHLRYLGIRSTKIKKLPKSVGNLYNLETLDMKYTYVQKLPTQINKLGKLRHIICSKSDKGVKIQEGIGCLEALQKLYYVDADHHIGIIKELGKLRQLRKLGIMKLTEKDCSQLCASINEMNHLQSLHIDSETNFDLNCIESPPRYLQHVHLRGNLRKLPKWIATLENLIRLQLINSNLVDDPLQLLQALPNLLLLRLHHAYEGPELCFEAGGFKNLKRMELMHLRNMCVLQIDEGALPILKELIIGHCPKLEKVPSDIKHLQVLNTLTCVDMSKSFIGSILPSSEGKKVTKFEHIPTVLIKQKEEIYRTYTLGDLDNEVFEV